MANTVRETADTVYATFRRLKPTEREAMIEHLLHDREFREDLLDVATVEQRRHEPGRPLRDYLLPLAKLRSHSVWRTRLS